MNKWNDKPSPITEVSIGPSYDENWWLSNSYLKQAIAFLEVDGVEYRREIHVIPNPETESTTGFIDWYKKVGDHWEQCHEPKPKTK